MSFKTKHIVSIVIVVLSVYFPIYLSAQWVTPTLDGTISANEYGSHSNGENMQVSNSSCGIDQSKWYSCWNDTCLYFALQNCFDFSGSAVDAVNIYIDIDNFSPVNNGHGTDTGYSFDGIDPVLPFRADFVAIAKQGYNGWRVSNGGWTGSDYGLTVAIGGTVTKKVIEIKIPWNTITEGNGRPLSFNFLAYLSYNCGAKASIPIANSASSQCGAFGKSEMKRYYHVPSTDTSSGTKPFSRECYTHIGNNVPTFGYLEIFNFTMNSPGKTVTRSGGDWTIDGDLIIHHGTVNFSSITDFSIVNGDCNISANGSLVLSNTTGGDFQIGGDLNVFGNFTINDREIEFDGNSGTNAQKISASSPIVFTSVILSNPKNIVLSTDITINNLLAIDSGAFILDTCDLILGDTAELIGNFASSKMIITNNSGSLVRKINNTGYYNFPVGENTGAIEYSLVEILINSMTPGPDPEIRVRVVNNKHPQNPSSSNYLERYWVIESKDMSNTNAHVSALYTDEDIVGNENHIYGIKYNPPTWVAFASVTEAYNVVEFQGVDSFSDFSGGDINALPIELLYFKARITQERLVHLEWATEQEIDNDYFEVERSKNAKDFTTISKVNGAGNSNTTRYYSIYDYEAGLGIVYYRLKQTDYDGKFSYSPIIFTELEGPPLTWVYSDASEIHLIYNSDKEERLFIEIFNIDGKVLYKNRTPIQPGKNDININSISPSSGLIFIRISGSTKDTIIKHFH